MDTTTRVASSSSSTTTTTKVGSTLHTRENSRDELDALFDPKRRLTTKPLSQRNLPDSFFRPPEFGTKTPVHSRQNSIDLTNIPSSTINTCITTEQQLKQKLLMNTQIGHHLRSISEPVQMTNNFTLPNNNEQNKNNQINSTVSNGSGGNVVNLHQRQFSVCTELPLPHGWEVAKTAGGQRYFINHITKETSWQDPRTFSLPNDNIENILKMIPLPAGWERAQTGTGEVYFINHNTKTTCWEDPRLPLIPSLLNQMDQQSHEDPFNGQPMTPTQTLGHSNSNISSSNNIVIGNNQISVNGNSNNINKQQLQQQNHEKQQLQMLLADILKKKNDLMKQLHEIGKQETLLKSQLQSNDISDSMGFEYLSSSSSSASPLNTSSNFTQLQQQQQLHSHLQLQQQQHLTAIQQRLQNQNTSHGHQHIRQSSADSGLGGMSGNHPPQYVNSIEVDNEPVNEFCKLNINQSMMLQQFALHNHLNQTNLSLNQADSMDATDSDSIDAAFLKKITSMKGGTTAADDPSNPLYSKDSKKSRKSRNFKRHNDHIALQEYNPDLAVSAKKFKKE